MVLSISTKLLTNLFRKFLALISFIQFLGYSQQNGRAECLNQTLNRCASTLLNSAKLPYKFWDSAILCAAYLLYITWIHIRVLIIKFQMNYFSINQLIFLILQFLHVKYFSLTITKWINLTITLNLVYF